MFIHTNHDLFTSKASTKMTMAVVYDPTDLRDSLPTAIAVRQRFRHITPFTFKTQADILRDHRTSTGIVFLIGVHLPLPVMKTLLHYAKQLYIVSNDPALKPSLDALTLFDDEGKLFIVYEEKTSLRSLTGRLTTLSDHWVLGNGAYGHTKHLWVVKTLVEKLGYTPSQLLALDERLETDPHEATNVISAYYVKADQQWAQCRQDGLVSGTFPLYGETYPLIVIPCGLCRREIAARAMEALNVSAVVVAYKRRAATGLYLYAPHEGLDAGHAARSFGGSGDTTHGDFTLDTHLDDFLD